MKYEFPTIHCLDDVRPALEGRDEIKIMEREADGHPYLIVDYVVNFPDTFPEFRAGMSDEEWHIAALRRECRGLIFDGLTEKLVARRYHKFFNINERDSTQMGLIPFDEDFIVLDKLDGSMVAPFMFPNTDDVHWDVYASPYLMKTYWGTRKGATQVADGARDHVEKSNFAYDEFATRMIIGGWTPIFEWMSPSFRIVLDYTHDQLVLTGVRHMETGVYMDYDEMVRVADDYGIPVVRRLTADDIHAFLVAAKDETELEGYVLRWADGHMLKSKNDWYCQIHKTKEKLVWEKDMLRIVLDRENIDDIRAQLPPNDRKRLDRYEESVMEGILRVVGEINAFVEDARAAMKARADQGEFEMDSRDAKKVFAMEYASQWTGHKLTKAILFQVYDGHKTFDCVNQLVYTHGRTQTLVDVIREVIGQVWNPELIEEAD